MKLPKLKDNKRKVKEGAKVRSPTFSYREVRNRQDRSTRINSEIRISSSQKRRFNAGLANTITWLTLIGVVLMIGWLLSLDTSPEVSIVNDNAAIKRDVSVYQQGISDLWSVDILNRNKVTLRSGSLISEIKLSYPEVRTVTIETRLLGNKASVLLELEKPKLILVTPEGGFYISENGKAMAKLGQIQGISTDGVPTILDESGLVPSVGYLALSGSEINSVIDIVSLCEAAGMNLSSVKLPNEPNQLIIVVQGTKYSVKFSLGQSAEQGVGALLALRDKFEKEGIKPGEYVDLRVPDKAFYK
jgi:hypothetical protein